MATTYAIVEDHILFAQAFKFMMNEVPDFEHLGTINDGSLAFAFLKEHQPDFIFLDINMPQLSGIDIIQQVRNANLQTKIIVVSMLTDALVIAKAIDAGANGYIPKNTDFDELLEAISEVKANRVFLPKDLKHVVEQIDLKHNGNWENRNMDEKVNLLSHREIEIVGLIAKGYTNPEIADQLFLSPLTVKTHRTNILRKLGLKNSASLISFATQVGWV